jgi:hypothetical protein
MVSCHGSIGAERPAGSASCMDCLYSLDYLHHMFRRLISRQENPPDVAKIRAESAFLRELRERLSASLQGSRCAVVGSAPKVVVPKLEPGDRSICVNGSPYAAKQQGVDNPDLTIINGNTTSLKSEKSRATVSIWKGLRTREVLFVETGDRERHARSVLHGVGFHYDRFTRISKWERAAIIGEVCGVELGIGNYDERVSNGTFAAILAVWGGAREIVMCGFSFRGGHNYIETELPRQHINGDRAFFECAKRLGFPLTTTSAEIHDDCGVPFGS